MKNKVDKIVVLLFIVTMCFLMSVSAHAETGDSYFFTSNCLLSDPIRLDGVTITPTNSSGSVKVLERTIFNENVKYYAKVCSGDNTATDFTIATQSQGVLIVYYARTWGENTTVNDVNDLKINGLNGIAECYNVLKGLGYGVKYYVLNANSTYTMTAIDLCGVYGFVYMPGNVAAYDIKGKGDFSFIGQYCKDRYDNLPVLKDDSYYLSGWYKDAAYTEKVTSGAEINEPTVLFARWTRCVWDFKNYMNSRINSPIIYDGIVIKGSDIYQQYINYSIINENGISFLNAPTEDFEHIEFTPEYDCELIVTYKSSSADESGRICAIGTNLITGSNINTLRSEPDILACGFADGESDKTLNAKLKAGTKYYIYSAYGGMFISKMQYVLGAASAVVDGNNVTLTTTANMQGWRAFYDADNSYTVDDNTIVYLVVGEDGDDAVRLCNMTGKKVPVACPVIMHTDAEQEDGTYLITMTKDDTPYTYDGDNLLRASVSGSSVNAYRLGYRAGENNGVAFYPWSSDNPSAGIVYLNLESSNAKIVLEMDESATGIVSVRKEDNGDRKIFNLRGQRLSAPQKGFNIINGKKIIVL